MRFRNQFSLLAVIVLLASQGACVRVNLDADNAGTKASKDVLSSSYSETIRIFSKHNWTTEQQPGNLITYCQALVESGAPLSPSLQEPDVPFHIAEFSRAYFMLLNGRAKESKAIFVGLAKDQNRSVWGLVGLLELAIYTRNIASMKNWLDGLRKLKKKNEAVARILPFYTLHYEFHMANYDKAERTLNEIGSTVEGLLMQVHLLVRENRFGDAQRLIDRIATSSDQQSRDIVIRAQAELISAQHGFERSTEYLKKMSDQFPEMWQVRLLYASHLTGLHGQGAREIAVQMLLSLANTRKHDLATQLVVINVLLDLRAHDEAGVLINGLPDIPSEFYYYNLILAKLDSLTRDSESRHLNLSEARAMFPLEPDGLWFAYRVSAMDSDYEGALAVLKMLLRLDPHDLYVLASLAQTYTAIEQWPAAQAVAISVLKSERYVDKALRNEMNEYRSRAAAKLQNQ